MRSLILSLQQHKPVKSTFLKRKIPITFASKVHLELKNETRIQLLNANFLFDLQRRTLEQLSNVN